MIKKLRTALLISSLLYGTTVTLAARLPTHLPPLWQRTTASIGHDYKDFYSGHTLFPISMSLGIAAMLANSSADQTIADEFQHHLRTPTTNTMAHWVKPFGNNFFILTYVGGSLIDALWPHHRVTDWLGDWSERSLRSILVGAPPVLLFQAMLGPSRPSVTDPNSHWQWFNQPHGVSGHAFLGAIPFLSAAFMTQNPWGKAAWFALATLPGLSRLNDNAHYFSQVLLGWSFAYFAEASVNGSLQHNRFFIAPVVLPGGVGAAVTIPLD